MCAVTVFFAHIGYTCRL